MPGTKNNEVPISFEKLMPETYMPRLQLFIRMMLGTLVAVYINNSPTPPLLLTLFQINLIIVSYFTFHLFWWWYYLRYGSKIFMIRLGSWVDLMGAVTAMLCDPFVIPPTILLLLISVLGNGIQHGLYVFVESMIGALIFGGSVIVVRFGLLEAWPPYNLYYYIFLIVAAVCYSYLLVRRIEFMKMEAIRISEHDGLTGILNRRAFLRAAEYLLLLHERGRIPLVVIFADLDNFKAVNDQFGHETGDKVLRFFSDMVRSRLRKSDIIARYGGDEFVMILTNTSLGSAESVLQRLQSEFRDWGRNRGLQVGVSFGLGMVPEGRNDLDDILRQVDAALYDAKLKREQAGIVTTSLLRHDSVLH